MKRILVTFVAVTLACGAYATRTLADPPVIHVPGGGPSGPPHIVVPGGGHSGPSHDGDDDDYHHGDDDDHGWHHGDDDDGYYHHNDGDYDEDDGYYVSQPVYISCAPAVVDSNVQTADHVLASLSANELRTSETFKRKVAEIAAMSAGKAKMDAYFRLVGLQNPNNPSEVLNFIYARQVDAKYVQNVSDNLQLTKDQATLVINRLTTALKPRQ